MKTAKWLKVEMSSDMPTTFLLLVWTTDSACIDLFDPFS